MSYEVANDVHKESVNLTLKVTGSTRLNKVSGPEWKYALDKFKQLKPIPASNIDDELFGRLQWSYSKMKDNETKICF